MPAAAPAGPSTTESSGAGATRLFASLWLLLAAILTHALIPSESPLARTTGSAFSATTLDVSLAPRKGEQPSRIGNADAGRSDGVADGGDPSAADATPAFAALQLPSSPPPGSHRAATPVLDLFPKTGQPRAPPTI